MIISHEQLKEQFGGNSPADVAARLERAGVRFLLGKSGRPFTTEFALNHAMGLPVGQLPHDDAPTHKPKIKVL